MSKNKENNHTTKGLRRKWPWIGLLCIVAIIGLARLSLMTGIVQDWVRGTIVNTANKQLIPELSIDNLSGDLWNEATLTNVALTDENRTVVASIDTIQLKYSPLSYFSDAFRIQEVRLTRPFVKLRQQPDSTWNVQNWIRTSDSSPHTTSSGFKFSLSQLLIEQGQADFSLTQLQQDSSFVVDNIDFSGSIGYYGDSYETTVRDFNFKIKKTRLDTPISFAASADADETSVTLEKLAIATGYSMFNASGHANLTDSTANFQAEASPLGFKDLATYVEGVPVQKDINVSLSIKGTISDFNVRLNANADGIKQFTLDSHFQGDSTLELRSFEVSANQFDLEALTGDSTMPSMQDMAFRAEGRVPLDHYQNTRVDGTLSAVNISRGAYRLDALKGSFTLKDKDAQFRLESAVGSEKLVADGSLSQLWGDKPFIHLEIHGSGINPANWLQDETYAGDLSFGGEVNGTGWYPEEEFWDYRFTIERSRLMGQRLDNATFSGRFNQQAVTNQSRISVEESKLHLQAEVRQLQTKPAFSYTVTGNNINFADFVGLEEYPSSVSATVTGKGKGNRLQDLEMQSSMRVDSSIFLSEDLQDFSVGIQIGNSVMNIHNGRLKSNIADGNFSGNIHLENFYDENNSLNLDMKLKDLSSFASVAEVEVLQAIGTVNGKLTPDGQDLVVFEGNIDLNEVNYDNQFVAPEVFGGIRVDLAEDPKFLADFNIVRPTIASVTLQNARLKTEGQRRDETINGSYEFELASPHGDSIGQAGDYWMNGDSLSVEMTVFDLTTRVRTLSLQKPFHISWANSTLQTDTLRISSEDRSAFLELAVPFADSLHQKGYLRTKKLNVKAIQDAMLDKSYLEGMLFSEVQIDRTDTSLVASGDLVISNLRYEETVVDTLLFQANIDNERLEGLMELHQGGELIAEGDLDIPFRAEKPELLDESFFEQPVKGQLVLHAIKLDRFDTLLKQAGYENTEGILRFEGNIEGQAGEPKLGATLNLEDALLSGVPIDSLVASVDYQHTQSNLNVNATLTSLKQTALKADARMPLDIDLRTWDIGLPSPEDSVFIAVQTNQFNLKALNDFLNRNRVRNLRGHINGQVEIEGPRNDLQTSGEINLKRGAFRVVPANIRLDNIASTVRFRPDEIELTDLRMKSGSGNLSARGTIALNDLVPGDMDLKVNAKNFKVANTEEYNGIINLTVDVAGNVAKPNLSGKLDVINGFIELDNFGEKSVEEVSLDTAVAPEPDISLYDSLTLDMDIGFNRRFFVRNQRYLEMELELDGNIDLLKDPGQDLQMFGTLSAVNGYAEPLGKRFELEQGSLAFSGPVDNPQINVRTLYEPPQTDQEIKIWYVIEGTVEDPQFKYESSPQMDLAGIISYTLFGQPFYKLNPAEQSVARTSSSNTAADFAMEVLMDRVESLATQHLGIDVVRIENTRVGSESGTSISTGWYINPKVFFAIQNVISGSTPTTGFYLEYYLKENLRLILSQGNDNRQGVDMQWEYDY